MKKHPFDLAGGAKLWSRVTRMPQAIGLAIAGALTVTSTAGVYLIVGLTQIAASMALTWVSTALTKKKSSGIGGSNGLLVNGTDSAAPHDIVYGRIRKGGTRVHVRSAGVNNKYLYLIYAIAGHRIDGFEAYYVNDEEVTMGAGGLVTSAPWNGKIVIFGFDGSQVTGSPNAVPDEVANSYVNFVGAGIAFMVVRLEADDDVFAAGIPLFTARIRGRRVIDPRTGIEAYSANAALCIRDYLRADFGLYDLQTDDANFAVAANVSDEWVDGERRYEINGVISLDMTPREIVANMLTACGGSLFWGQGKWKLRPAYYTAPVKTFTLDDLRGSISLDTRASSRDNFNKVSGVFADRAANYVTVDYPPVTNSVFLAEDGGVENLMDLELPMTTSAAVAQRLAKLTLFRGREQMTLTADFGLSAFDVQIGDIVAFTNPRYGWVAKEFEVSEWKFGADQEAGDLRVTMTLRETSSAAYAWNSEAKTLIYNNSTLPNYRLTIAPGISLSAYLRVVNRAVMGVLEIKLSTSLDVTPQYEVQYKPHASTQWLAVGSGVGPVFDVLNLVDGYYDVRARSSNILGIKSEWTYVSNWFLSVFSPPPATVLDFSANVVGSTLYLAWSQVPDLDLSHYKIRYSSVTSGALYQNSVDLMLNTGSLSNGVAIPARSGTYFIKAVDLLGNLSVNAASVVVIADMTTISSLNFIENYDEFPALDGYLQDAFVSEDGLGQYISLTSTPNFDSVVGDFDAVSGLWDGGGLEGEIVSVGIYQFRRVLDLGAVYTSRVSGTIATTILDMANDWDGVTLWIDDYQGDWDGDPVQYDMVSVQLQISTSMDAVNWSDFSNFHVGDYTARAMRFRALMTSQNTKLSPAIRQLSVSIDMPDRVEGGDDLVFTGSKAVVFASPFRVAPTIAVNVTLVNGDRYAITDKTQYGFTIRAYTGAAVSTNPVTFDYVAKGYGRAI